MNNRRQIGKHMAPSDNPSRGWVELEAKVERKDPSLPRFITVPSASVETWNLTSTSPVEVEIDAVPIGRRSLKYWRKQDSWFFDLTERHCRDLGIDRGDVVEVRITPADPVSARRNPGASRSRFVGEKALGSALPVEAADRLGARPGRRARGYAPEACRVCPGNPEFVMTEDG